MKRYLTIAALFFGLSIASATSASAHSDHEEHKLTICHATHSATNPYVRITVDLDAVDGEGQNDHTHHEADIIPPHGESAGQNWTDEGQAIFANGCEVPTPTSTTVPPVVTTVPPTTVPPVTTLAPPTTITAPTTTVVPTIITPEPALEARPSTLAYTGSHASLLAALGFATLALGCVLVALARRSPKL